MMDNQEIIDLLNRYKKNECTAEETARLEAWYNQVSQSGSWNWTEDEKSQIGSSLKNKIDRQIERQNFFGSHSRWVWAAACIVLLLGAGGELLYQKKGAIRIEAERVQYAETIVPAGQRKRVVLSDGSTVWLNASSRLKYPKKFIGPTREIILLQGEAYFDVRHDAQKPFIVLAGNTRVQVLGTAFNVCFYSLLANIEVTVKRGKVLVGETGKAGKTAFRELILQPNERASINKQTGKLKKSHVDAEGIIGWTEGRLVFNNASFRDLANVLEYTYNIHVHFVGNGLESYRFTAGFDSTDRLKDILFAISRANSLYYTLHNNEVTFKKKSKTIKPK